MSRVAGHDLGALSNVLGDILLIIFTCLALMQEASLVSLQYLGLLLLLFLLFIHR